MRHKLTKLITVLMVSVIPLCLAGCPTNDDGSLEEGIEEVGDEIDDATDL